MLKFHVDLHSTNPDDDSQDVKFHAIVNAENIASAKQEALAVMQNEQPELKADPSWQWSIYEFPLG